MIFRQHKIPAGTARDSQEDLLATRRIGSRHLISAVCVALAGLATVTVAKSDKTDFVRLSKPEVLTFDETGAAGTEG